MPRPTKATLYQIDPDRLATDVATAVEAHVASLAFHVGKSLVDMGPCDLRYSVRDLAHYAIHGGPLDAPVQEYLISMLPIWSRASDGACVSTPEFDDPDSVDPLTWVGQLAIVMRAAYGRERIAGGWDVSPAELAVLGGMSARNVRALLRAGEIRGEDDGSRWIISAEEASRWLATRQTATDSQPSGTVTGPSR